MATWAPLRKLLAEVDDAVTLTWKELDDLVGGLPPSADQYREFWAGDRSGWPGFRTKNVQVGKQVTFERAHRGSPDVKARRAVAAAASSGTSVDPNDELILRAAAATGIADKDSLVRAGLETLIRLASGRRLAAFGGTDPRASAAPRRRDDGA